MRFTDFIYDGVQLSSMGLTIGQIDSSGGVETGSAGSKITFTTVPMHSGKYHSLTSTKYDECLETTFDIYKDPCNFADMTMTENEARIIMRWLNRRQFYPFRFVYDSDYDSLYFKTSDASVVSDKIYYARTGSGTIMSPYIFSKVSSPSTSNINQYYELYPFSRCYKKTSDKNLNTLAVYFTKTGLGTSSSPYSYEIVTSPSKSALSNYYEANGCEYESSFNVEYIKVDDAICGLRITMTTNKPFGYGDTVSKTINSYTRNEAITIANISDESYDTPLNIKFTMLDNVFSNKDDGGKLVFKFYPDNGSHDELQDVSVNGLKPNESIEIDGLSKIITTNKTAHKIYKDFNFMFPKIGSIKKINKSIRTLGIKIASDTSGWNSGSPAYCDVTIGYRPIIKGNIF